MVNSTLVATLYVNPVTGNDANTGMRGAPLKSLSRALKVTSTPAIIRLAPGSYNAANGEKFPLVIPEGVTVVGNEANRGLGIVIDGGGNYQSLTFGVQNITLLLLDDAYLLGVTVTNHTPKGTGVWIESTMPVIANNTFTNCGREGIFVTGNAKPVIRDNAIARNGSGGLVFANNSKGECIGNLIRKNPLGLAVTDNGAPMIVNNQITENKVAIALAKDSRAVLRGNIVSQNTDGGLLINGNGIPDFGHIHDPAANRFSDNQNFDVFNNTKYPVISVGNNLNPAHVKGTIEFRAATVELNPQFQKGGVFTDIGGHWAREFIEGLASQDLISGFPDGGFQPENRISRAEYAALVARIFKLPAINANRFSDVPQQFWAAGVINAAASAGFLGGFPDGTFRPQQALTKVQALVSLVNGLKLTAGDANLLSMYRDRAQIPSYAVGAVATATQNMLVVNYPDWDVLEPLRDITRGEIAAIVYQTLVVRGLVPAIRSPYIVLPNTQLPTFSDLPGHWAEPFIRGLASLKLINGFADGSFKPDQPMNRAEYAVLITNAFNPAPKRNPSQFVDVPKKFWAHDAILKATAGGFVSGFSDRTFRPEQHVQRLQVIVSLVSGLSLPPQPATNLASIYKDIQSVPQNTHTAIATATHHRLVVNYPHPNQLLPQKPATRGEVAAFVYQAMVTTGRIRAIASPYIVNKS
ncbi:S-layer homology domain-containing protein [Calothrix sp. NIES-3974]|uniref:S-layer homology domain-containing protein n=1 Tax=Calothrix sp. NIES-3974 TaxID=2005462 RepID=UPI000B60E88B|nr:S-layer homology domain-containing protein [Calothrix sp. NIES-3974]BAZ08101.1 hypothetical protein NIES3974_47700 [Calothrix sp. NIES-3974]